MVYLYNDDDDDDDDDDDSKISTSMYKGEVMNHNNLG